MKLRCWSCEKALGLRFVLVSGSDVIKHVDHCYLACVTCAGQQQEGHKAYVSREITAQSVAHTVAQKAPKTPRLTHR